MGFFSWKFADVEGRLKVGGSAYIALPDDTYLKIYCYDGYGHVGFYDIYELVVDWNKDFLKRNLEGLLSNKIPHESDVDHFDKSLFEKYIELDFDDEAMIDYMRQHPKYKSTCMVYDWKRELGIYIACYDEDNASLDYPIKITKTDEYMYAELPASEHDPLQGCD